MDGEGKDKKEIRRPMNAFLIFCKRHRSVVRQKHPDMDNRSITRLLGDLWANLGEEKNIYINLAKQYKDAFLKANPNYRWHSSDKFLSSSKLLTKSVNPWTMKNMGDISTEGCITPGKLADLDKMGGLNLLLMADKETSYDGPTTSLSAVYSSAHKASSSAPQPLKCEPSTSSANNALLQLAEMCSSELNYSAIKNSAIKSQYSNCAPVITHAIPQAVCPNTNSPYHQPMPPPKKRARHWSLTEIDSLNDSLSARSERDEDAEDSLELSPLNLSLHNKRFVSLPQLEKYSDVEHFKRSTPKRRLSSSATESIPSPLPSYLDGAESPVFSDSLTFDKPDNSSSDVKSFEPASCDGEKLPIYEHCKAINFVPQRPAGPGSLHLPSNSGKATTSSAVEMHSVSSVKSESLYLPRATLELNAPEMYRWEDYRQGRKNEAIFHSAVEKQSCKKPGVALRQANVKHNSESFHSGQKPANIFTPSNDMVVSPGEHATIALARMYEKVKSQSLAEANTPVSSCGQYEQNPKASATSSLACTEVKLKKKWVERMLVENKLQEDIHKGQSHARNLSLPVQHYSGDMHFARQEVEQNGHALRLTAGPSQRAAQKQCDAKLAQNLAFNGCSSQSGHAPASFSAISHPKLMMQLSQNQVSHSYQPGQIWQQKCWSENQTKELPHKLSAPTKEPTPTPALKMKETKERKEPVLKPLAACGQKVYDHILQQLSSSDFNLERPVHSQLLVNTQLSANIQLSANTQLPRNAQLPVNTQLPVNAQLPANTQLSANTQVPVNTQLQVNTQMPVNTQHPVNNQLPVNTQPPVNAQLSANTQLPVNSQLPVNMQIEPPVSSAVTAVNPIAEISLKEEIKEEKVWPWQDNSGKPMTASSLVEKVVREVCGSPPRKDGCNSCCKADAPLTSFPEKHYTGDATPSTMTCKQEVVEEEVKEETNRPSVPRPNHDTDAPNKWQAPVADSVEQSDHDDSSVPQVRKSRRANRGQKYQKLIKEGFIQPSRERLAARNAERHGKSFGTREEFEKLECKKVLKRSASEKDAVSQLDSVSCKVGSTSPSSDTAMTPGDEKRFKTGAFDLEKEIESLPVCSLEQMEKKKVPRRRSDNEPQTSCSKTLTEVESGNQLKTPETVCTVNFQNSGCPAPHIPLPKEKRSLEPVTGSRKRKARSYCITRIYLHAEADAKIVDQLKEPEKKCPPTHGMEQVEHLSGERISPKQSTEVSCKALNQKLDRDLATSALLKLADIKSENSNKVSAEIFATKGSSPIATSLENSKKQEGALSKTSKKPCLSTANNDAPEQHKMSKPVKSEHFNTSHASVDVNMVSSDARHNTPSVHKNGEDNMNVIGAAIHPLNKGDKNVIISSLKVPPARMGQRELKAVCTSLMSHDGHDIRLLSTLSGHTGSNQIQQISSEKLASAKKSGQLSKALSKNAIDRQQAFFPIKDNDIVPSSVAVTLPGSMIVTEGSLSQKHCLGTTCAPGTTTTVVIALPSCINPQTAANLVGESDRRILAASDAYVLVSPGGCYGLSTSTPASMPPSSSLFTVAPSVISLPNSPSAAINDIVSYSVIGAGSVVEAGSPHMIGSPRLPESPSVAVAQS